MRLLLAFILGVILVFILPLLPIATNPALIWMATTAALTTLFITWMVKTLK